MEEGKVVAGVVVLGEGVDSVVNPVGRIAVATVVDSGTVKALSLIHI